jgi:glycosyltransferase involved in cell wall biosynthesis
MNARDPLVTVLMPVYNAGAYLQPTLETILGQTYRDFEFLIINDCSIDGSLETIRSLGDPRIRVHTNSVNMGQTKSLNVGLRLARGKFVVVNDADDYSLPRRIETQLDFIMKNPQYPVVGTSCYIMDGRGEIQRTFLRPTDLREIHLQYLSDTPMTHGSVIMNREAILKMGGYNEEFRIIQDYELWSTLMRNGLQVMNLPDLLVVIRTFSDSISFKQRETQTIENGKTIKVNIAAMTGIHVSLEEAIRQRLFFISPEILPPEDFNNAEQLFIREYEALRPSYRISKDYVRHDLSKRLVKPYAKLSIALLEEGRSRAARQAVGNYLIKYGPQRFMLMLWALSFLSSSTLDLTMRFYGSLKRWTGENSYSTARIGRNLSKSIRA